MAVRLRRMRLSGYQWSLFNTVSDEEWVFSVRNSSSGRESTLSRGMLCISSGGRQECSAKCVFCCHQLSCSSSQLSWWRLHIPDSKIMVSWSKSIRVLSRQLADSVYNLIPAINRSDSRLVRVKVLFRTIQLRGPSTHFEKMTGIQLLRLMPTLVSQERRSNLTIE